MEDSFIFRATPTSQTPMVRSPTTNNHWETRLFQPVVNLHNGACQHLYGGLAHERVMLRCITQALLAIRLKVDFIQCYK
jgi:hypothetical protein